MPTIKVFQNNFTTGEISPQVCARVDLSKYEGACKLIRNAIPMAQGGITKRPGTRFVAEAADGILIPFVYSNDQTYALLFMENRIRFYTDGGVVLDGAQPYEVATDYLLDELPEIKFAQTMDVMYLVHPKHPPKKLSRYGHTDWTLEDVEFQPGISAPTGLSVTVTGFAESSSTLPTTTEYKVSAVNANGEESLPSAAVRANTRSTWMQGDRVGLKWYAVPGAVRYEVYKNEHGWFEWAGSTTETSFLDDNIEPDSSESPKEYRDPFCDPGEHIPESVEITGGTPTCSPWSSSGTPTEPWLEVKATEVNTGGAESYPVGCIVTGSTAGETVTVTGSGANDTELYNVYFRRNGEKWKCTTVAANSAELKMETSISGSLVALYEDPKLTKVNTYKWTLGKVVDTSYDHAKTLYTKRLRVTAANLLYHDRECTMPTSVKKIVRVIDDGPVSVTFPIPDAFPASPPDQEDGAKCYPGAVGIFQQRLMFGRTDRNPQTVWMSETGAYNSMAVSHPLRDDSAITAMVDTRKRNEVRHFVSLSDAFVLTDATEFRMTDKDGVITPGTIGFRPQSYWGSSHVPPIVVGTTILMVDASGRVVRDVHYNLQEDGYSGDNRSILAEHLFPCQIRDWSYQEIPFSTVYVVREDGKLLTFTYMREQEIWAWAQHESDDGVFRSVCTVRENGKDMTYFLVKRGTKYFVEEQDIREFGEASTESFFVDCGIELKLALEGSTTDVIDLPHLAGKTVYGIADGSLVGPLTVPSNGTVTLPREANHVIMGLPYSMEVRTADPDIKGDDGTRFGKNKTVGPVTLELLETASVEAGADENHLETFKIPCHDEWGAPIALFSGKFRAPTPGFARDEASVLIRSRDPFPATVLAVKVEVRLD